MIHYQYSTVIHNPHKKESFAFETNNLDEVCDKLNKFYYESCGLDSMLNRDKLQSYISGRCKYPSYLKNLKIMRNRRYVLN